MQERAEKRGKRGGEKKERGGGKKEIAKGFSPSRFEKLVTPAVYPG